LQIREEPQEVTNKKTSKMTVTAKKRKITKPKPSIMFKKLKNIRKCKDNNVK